MQGIGRQGLSGHGCRLEQGEAADCGAEVPDTRPVTRGGLDLPALDFEALKAGKEDPKVVEFMSKVVKPEMAKLLNEPEMTETEPKGFGCLHCHTMKKKK